MSNPRKIARTIPTINKAAWTVVVAVLSGCGGPDRSPEADRPAGRCDTSASSTTDGWVDVFDPDKMFKVSFRPTPGPITASKMFTLDVHVVRNSDQSSVGEDVGLIVDAAMPEHRHGMNTQPRIERTGPGRFEARGMLLHMPGRWEIYFDMAEGALTQRATFEIELD
jgi:hypothetical protein